MEERLLKQINYEEMEKNIIIQNNIREKKTE